MALKVGTCKTPWTGLARKGSETVSCNYVMLFTVGVKAEYLSRTNRWDDNEGVFQSTRADFEGIHMPRRRVAFSMNRHNDRSADSGRSMLVSREIGRKLVKASMTRYLATSWIEL